METIKANIKNLKAVKSALENNKVIVFPTDTVYGLICKATSKKAVEKLFKIKKRPKGKAIPIFIKDIKMAKKFAFIDNEKEKFLNYAWPGKVTVVLKKKNIKIFGATEKAIGLRIPDYKFLTALFKEINFPLSGTSANISGKPASEKIEEAIKQFKDEKIQPDLVFDAGDLPENLPSAVIDLTGKKIKILRKR